jgi:hypothetical protein
MQREFLSVLHANNGRKEPPRFGSLRDQLRIHRLRMAKSRTPERLLTELTTALKQTNSPLPPAVGDDPAPLRFPLYNGEIPPKR